MLRHRSLAALRGSHAIHFVSTRQIFSIQRGVVIAWVRGAPLAQVREIELRRDHFFAVMRLGLRHENRSVVPHAACSIAATVA